MKRKRMTIFDKYLRTSPLSLVATVSTLLFGHYSCSESRQPARVKPNILLILADDMGYSDLGCYGGEINTPNIDRLANNGVRFKTFYNMAKCNPSRSSLLTGYYRLNNREMSGKSDTSIVPVAELMRRAGYQTMMCGKEHFDRWVPDHCYARNSFDQSFVYWATTQYFLPSSGKLDNQFVLNGKELKPEEIPVSRNPFYKTDAVTDMAIKWIDESLKGDRPFFLHLAYHVPHYPLQAREEDIARYRGKYMEGWDKIRERRFEKMKKLGLMPHDAKISPPGGTDNSYVSPFYPGYNGLYSSEPPADEERRKKIGTYRPWVQLDSMEMDEMDLEMAVYAAMVDRMDQNIGRIVEKLENAGALENTLILFLSDNGACPYDRNHDFEHPPGGADSYRSLSAAWANATNTPFRYFKWAGHEGGCNTPLVAHWPRVIKKGLITDQPGHIVDIIPTFLDITDARYPAEYKGEKTIPLNGHSLVPIFEGKQREQPEFFISGLGKGLMIKSEQEEDNGKIVPGTGEEFVMFRHQNWKIAKWNNSDWELFDLENDPTEVNDLADKMPDKVIELEKMYEEVKLKL